ncbi:hypothetical protein KCH_73910 [Kitasatospora cheerisanensis KCTC 2395]|uniref:Uncharacterized protein n=1 Tax=Kitasatospora cheerisanensis KCTC 2395 TaxID=1348663 RepID=A0A066YS28_9ACTN|nr:hypothetical protein KCH_73910 [Kitasatospora cheerisanensis KCTC 2395]
MPLPSPLCALAGRAGPALLDVPEPGAAPAFPRPPRPPTRLPLNAVTGLLHRHRRRHRHCRRPGSWPRPHHRLPSHTPRPRTLQLAQLTQHRLPPSAACLSRPAHPTSLHAVRPPR